MSRRGTRRAYPCTTKAGDQSGVAAALRDLGHVAQTQGDYAWASSLYEQSLAKRIDLWEKAGIADCLDDLAEVARHRGEYDRAEALDRAALALQRGLGDIRGVAYSLNELANVARHRGDYAQGIALCEQALALQRELGDQRSEGWSVYNLGLLVQAQGDPERALRLYEEALSLFREVGDQRGISNGISGMSDIARTRGDLQSARELLAALEVVTDRLQRAESAGGPVVRLIFDINCAFLHASGEYTAALVEQLANPILVAVGLGGPESDHPRTLAAPTSSGSVERATLSSHTRVRPAPPSTSVIDLKARRVQHGVHAVDDAEVLQLLTEHGIACDIALTSNLLLTTFRDLKSHPIRQLFQAGVPVTLSTDDPAFFNTDLTREYELARDEVGLSLEQLWDINMNGLRFGLAELPLRRRLLQEFVAEGAELGLATAKPSDV